MPNINYYYSASGVLTAKWPGTTTYVDGKPRKSGQIHLGQVVDKEKGIFWNRQNGYCKFDAESKTLTEANLDDIPHDWREMDSARKEPTVCVDFGDSYFLNQLINGIEYNKILDQMYSNNDRTYAMLFFYILEDKANYQIARWYRQNMIQLLYPKANVYSQRVSEFLKMIGTENAKRDFLVGHIEYILKNVDGEVCVIIDSSGIPNSCNLPITRVSNHEGDINVEFRLIALIHKRTGLPLYYEVIPGNVVDISTLEYIMKVAEEHNLHVQCAYGDAGYCCPANMEKMVLSGIDFMTRLNPAYDQFKNLMAEHGTELESAKVYRYKDRYVRIIKTSSVVGHKKDTGEPVKGYIFLCKDLKAEACKKATAYSSDVGKTVLVTEEDLKKRCERLGIFALITTQDISEEEALPEYYTRQEVEQFFDYGKNYAKYVPAREHSKETLNGHLLISFIATFITILIKNRLKVVGSRYTAVPMKQVSSIDETCGNDYVIVEDENGNKTYFIEQDPLVEVFNESPISLFFELRGHKAQVFPKKIIPCVSVKQANDFYNAFGIHSPVEIIRENTGLQYVFKKDQKNKVARKKVFAEKPTLTDEEIEAKKVQQQRKKLETMASKIGTVISDPPPPKRGRGRPPGSKNKKTLEKEAAQKSDQSGKTENNQKHGRGRPKGSKNKKTLEREAKKAENEHSSEETPVMT